MYSKTAVLENNGYSDLKRNQDVDLFGRMQFEGYKAEILTKPFFGLEVLMNWQREERVGRTLGVILLPFVSFGKWDTVRLQIMQW